MLQGSSLRAECKIYRSAGYKVTCVMCRIRRSGCFKGQSEWWIRVDDVIGSVSTDKWTHVTRDKRQCSVRLANYTVRHQSMFGRPHKSCSSMHRATFDVFAPGKLVVFRCARVVKLLLTEFPVFSHSGLLTSTFIRIQAVTITPCEA